MRKRLREESGTVVSGTVRAGITKQEQRLIIPKENTRK